jgi:putative ABC transport system permease protein
MFKSNFKIAIRNLFRQKVYAFINIAGLAVGVASCILIVLFVKNEFSYDTFFKDKERIHRMVLERIYPTHSTYYAFIPHSFEEVAKRDFAEIESSTLAWRFQNISLSYKDERDEVKQFDEEQVLAVDSSFLGIFDFKFVKGSAQTSLQKANEIVVTEEFALRYFNTTDALGKVVRAGDQEFSVAAVLENIPENSHFKFSALLSLSTFPFVRQENFRSFSAYTYFKLKEGTDAKVLESKFPVLVDKYAAAQIERELGKSWEDYKKEGNGYRYFLQALPSIHLDPVNLEGQMKPSGNITTVYILIGVAVLILVIACINFMNLSTARSAERAKEVGVRKVMGSFKQQLVSQFLTESFVLSAIGVLLSIGIVFTALPFFNNLIGKELLLTIDFTSALWLLGFTIVIGLLSGLYPAFILSSFNPVVVMKGKFTGNANGKWIRNGLVVFQFWISIILIIGTLVIRGQMEYMQSKSLGFDKEQVLVVERGFNLTPPIAKTFVDEVRQLPQVVSAAGSFAMPSRDGDFFGLQFQPQGSSEILTTKSMVVGDELTETLGFELLDGRWFSQNTNDSLSILLNEKAVKVLGIEDPVGKTLMGMVDQPDGTTKPVPFAIVGIVKDFNFMSLRDEVTPLVIQSNEVFNGGLQYIVARVKPNEIETALQSIEAKWKAIVPGQPFKFFFLDETINSQYQTEKQSGRMFSVFSGLAIFVACIGLFALSAYITTLRTKEIGVRKVLGASVGSVLLLLSKDFTKMIALAFVLAVPVAWYVMENWWLSNFAYRIEITIGIIAIAGISTLLIAWITVSFQSIKAAIRNPIKSLRYE